jgi:hypothetical protein
MCGIVNKTLLAPGIPQLSGVSRSVFLCVILNANVAIFYCSWVKKKTF